MSGKFTELLNNTTAGDIISKNRPLYSVLSTSTVEETMQVLSENKVLSVPIRNPETNEYTDFIDVLDIICYFVSICKDINTLVHLKPETFTEKQVGEISNLSNKDPFITVNTSDPASSVLELFAKGVHRVLLKNEDGKVTNVLSQFDFLTFIVNNIDTFSDLASKSIKEIGLVQSWVLHVRKSERVLTCFKKAAENRVNAVSVVDVEGKLHSYLSSSSLRGLTADSISKLRLPVSDFHTAQKVNISKKSFVCNGSDSFANVLNVLVENGSHRLWVEDAAGFPVGVVSLTDICSVLNNK